MERKGGSSATNRALPRRLEHEPEHERGTECSLSGEVRPSDRHSPLTPDPSTDPPPGSHGDPIIASSRNRGLIALNFRLIQSLEHVTCKTCPICKGAKKRNRKTLRVDSNINEITA